MEKLDLPITSGGPAPPHHWFNAEGLQARLQIFLIVRDGERRIAAVREKAQPELWRLPGETVMPNEDIDAAAKRVSKLWFEKELDASVAQVVTFPDTGDQRWYIVFIYEATVGGLDDLGVPDDTEEVRFVEPGKAPGPWAMDHGSLFDKLGP